MVHGYCKSQHGQRQNVGSKRAESANERRQRDNRNGIHGDALIPAQLAGGEVCNLAEVQASEHGTKRHEEDEQRTHIENGRENGRGPPCLLSHHQSNDRDETRREHHHRQNPAEELHCFGVHPPILAACRPATTSNGDENRSGRWQYWAVTSASVGIDALKLMRVTRRRHRVADLEWFEALYRVYLAAFIGGGMILFLSGLVGDTPLTARELTDLSHRGPGYVGIVMGLAIFMGARSGVNGGPVSIEDAEVRYVLLAPVPRTAVLRRPAIQRVRSTAFAGVVGGGTIGQLVGRRAGAGTAPLAEWLSWGVLAGAVVSLSFVVAALIAHESGLARPAITAVTGAPLAWQVWACVTEGRPPGPFTFVGRLALWPLGHSAWNLAGIPVVLAATVFGIIGVHRLSLEALAARSALVTQLKFAVTMQDLRTVVLLRRQLSSEHPRPRPWFSLPAIARRRIIVARGLRGLARFPARRLGRMALTMCAAATSLVLVWRGTTPFVVVSGMLLFVFGLDSVEPLSQEVDQADRCDSLPMERGALYARHIVAPTIMAVPFLLLGILVAVVLERSTTTMSVGMIVGIPAVLAGIAGAVVSVVKGSPDPAGDATRGLALPPEMSGMGTVLRTVWPPTIAVIGTTPLLVARFAHEHGEHVVGSAVRGLVGVGFMLFLVVGWVQQRDAIHAWFRNMQMESRYSTTDAADVNSSPPQTKDDS